jgi:hypothetical protein
MSKYLVTLQGDEPELGSWLSRAFKFKKPFIRPNFKPIKPNFRPIKPNLSGVKGILNNVSFNKLKKLNLGQAAKGLSVIGQTGNILKNTLKLKNPLTTFYDKRLNKIKNESIKIGAVTGNWDLASAYLNIKNKQISGQRKRYLQNLDRIGVGTAAAIATAGAAGLLGGGAGAVGGSAMGTSAGSLGGIAGGLASSSGFLGTITGGLGAVSNLLQTGSQIQQLANQVQQFNASQDTINQIDKQEQSNTMMELLQKPQETTLTESLEEKPFGMTLTQYQQPQKPQTQQSDNTILYIGAGLILLLFLSKQKRGKK